MTVHLAFDLAAAGAAFAMAVFVYLRFLQGTAADTPARVGAGYAAALVLGAALGGYGFGTANLVLSGIEGVGRSILGALAGGIAGVEIFKAAAGIRGSTGLVFVAPFATSVVIGRIGCLLSGIEDRTYGIATALPWGIDKGDGVPRHPVEAYEALAMAAFLAWYLRALSRGTPFVRAHGFTILVFFYAAQRFLWEFLKPYAAVVGPLNLFHLVCLGLMAYAGAMILGRSRHAAYP